MRVQVEINIEQPLPDGFPLTRYIKSATWISFKYERLSDFCYCCGCLGHIQQSCPNLQTQIKVTNFGPWMRADNTGGRRMLRNEIQGEAQPPNFHAIPETRQFFPTTSNKGKEKFITKNQIITSISTTWSNQIQQKTPKQVEDKGKHVE